MIEFSAITQAQKAQNEMSKKTGRIIQFIENWFAHAYFFRHSWVNVNDRFVMGPHANGTGHSNLIKIVDFAHNILNEHHLDCIAINYIICFYMIIIYIYIYIYILYIYIYIYKREREREEREKRNIYIYIYRELVI